jgi:hypothetical protein
MKGRKLSSWSKMIGQNKQEKSEKPKAAKVGGFSLILTVPS